jgi:hypothetical protein
LLKFSIVDGLGSGGMASGGVAKQAKKPKRLSQTKKDTELLVNEQDAQAVIDAMNTISHTDKHHYPPEVKQLVLLLHSVGHKPIDIKRAIKADRGIDISDGALHAWINGQGLSKLDTQSVTEALKDSMASRLLQGASRALSMALEDERMDKMSSFQLSTIACQLTDKFGLLTDGNKITVEHVHQKVNNQRGSIVEVEASVTDAKDDLLGSCGDTTKLN